VEKYTVIVCVILEAFLNFKLITFTLTFTFIAYTICFYANYQYHQ